MYIYSTRWTLDEWLSKALIKFVKKAIDVVVWEQNLSFSEFQTFNFETGNLINERPIGGHLTSPEDGGYLSPNILLLSRTIWLVPAGPLRELTNLRNRFYIIQENCEQSFGRQRKHYFECLVVSKYWQTELRNIQIKDIVLARDSNQVHGNWQLEQITKVRWFGSESWTAT